MTLHQRTFTQTQPASEVVSPFAPGVVAQASIDLSGPLPLDLNIYRGDTGRFRITVTDEVGGPINISGATWDADIRSVAANPTAITSFTVTPVAGDPSSVDVILDKTKSALLNPGTLVYDVEMTLGLEVVTLVGGKITVTQDVSRTP